MANTNTALSGNFEICQSADCNSFSIEDTSGLWDTLNTGGWGGINPAISDVDVAFLTLLDPSNISVVYDLVALSSGSFPNTLGNPLSITPVTAPADGVYEATYYLQGDTIGGGSILWSVENTQIILFTCNVDCCLAKLLATIKSSNCSDCRDDILMRVVRAKAYLDGAKKAACCGDKDRAVRLLNNASYLCDATSCKNCS